MIRKVEIRHFKCFERLTVEGCRRINVIVGDNGIGKTALLEAIFFALGGTTELMNRFRAIRGFDQQQSFRGSLRKVADALSSEYFYNQDTSRPITISLDGDGSEARSLKITRGGPGVVTGNRREVVRLSPNQIHFEWTDSKGGKHPVIPTISAKEGITWHETGEDLPDFFFFSAGYSFSSIDNAERFSDMSRAKRQQDLVQFIKSEYTWVQDLDIEVFAGLPAIYATVPGLDDKVALSSLSGGINRFVGALLALASRRRSVIVADELENGLYYTHHRSFWDAIIKFARSYEGQIFTSTHSLEWIKALVEVAGDDNQDIALWRIERDEEGHPEVRQFSGSTLRNAIERGVDARGE